MSFPMESLRIQTGLDPRNQCILIHDRLADRFIRCWQIDPCGAAYFWCFSYENTCCIIFHHIGRINSCGKNQFGGGGRATGRNYLAMAVR